MSFLAVIEMMNSSKVPVVSLDCPSGLDCNRGVVEAVVKSTMTVTFEPS
ncbi:MAG: NAD(P)H-hydrate epimerase [Bdellovibrionales bacterium]